MRTSVFISKHVAIGLIVAGLAATPACTPGGPTSATDRDLVTTFFDQNKNFGAIRTYAMPDEVIVRDEGEPLPEESEAIILGAVARNMESLGYRRESNPEQNGADVVVLVGANQQTTITWWVSWPWWGGWGFWPGWGYWPGFGPGWGVRYPIVGATATTTGSVFIDMVDPDDADLDNQVLPVVWTAGLSGVVSRDEQFNQGRVVSAIDQAFRQSPYLGSR